MMWNPGSGGNGTIGMNSTRKIHEGSTAMRHAEIDAMLRLPSQKRGSRPTKVSLIVIRISTNGELRNSRPCVHCLKRLGCLSSLGYNLRNVYYSNEFGVIVNAKYEDLLKSDVQHVTRGNRK